MPKRIKPEDADFQRMVSKKFRTTPIKSTIKHITGLPKSAILYKCEASSFWQFRVHLEGKPRKRSTKEEEIGKAEREAKKIYADMLKQISSGEISVQPTTRNTLQQVAKSLWAKNQTRIKNDELHGEKVAKDTYVFERHIKPFFARYDIKDIDLDLLEQFKSHLADQGLSAATQISYINIVMALLKEAQIKRLISHLPPKPRVRTDDGVRGYFDDKELSELTRAIRRNRDQIHEFKDGDGKTYRKTRITEELLLLVNFMIETYIRPTDVKVLKHEDVKLVKKSDITFLVLEHEKTKLHKKNMVSTERGLIVYRAIIDHRGPNGAIGPKDYLFLPEYPHRDSALKNLSTQFSAILAMIGMEEDRHGKPRTLYSLRHTAIVGSLRKGIPIELVASNARTSTDMIRRFYGSHIDNILETGTVYVEKEKERRDKRFNLYNQVVADLRRVSNNPMYDTSAEREEAAEVAELIKIRQEAAKGDGGKEREQKAKKIVRRKSRSADDEDS
ncbi:MAG: phage integrase SAM-like domain-containing protein [Hyphomicrobiales bacterium]|nr:phage integrase SAM-like domain-containing protein [Hyphomicrobiales bacterium]